MSQCFAFLDSDRKIPQPVQQLVLRDFARANGLEIEFVGAEIEGNEKAHRLYAYYLSTKKSQRYLFFSVYQFMGLTGRFEAELLNKAVSNNIELYFALEKLAFKSKNELSAGLYNLRTAEIIRGSNYTEQIKNSALRIL